jgi:hypothetical protein
VIVKKNIGFFWCDGGVLQHAEKIGLYLSFHVHVFITIFFHFHFQKKLCLKPAVVTDPNQIHTLQVLPPNYSTAMRHSGNEPFYLGLRSSNSIRRHPEHYRVSVISVRIDNQDNDGLPTYDDYIKWDEHTRQVDFDQNIKPPKV